MTMLFLFIGIEFEINNDIIKEPNKSHILLCAFNIIPFLYFTKIDYS